jgi:hypothetical protein
MTYKTLNECAEPSSLDPKQPPEPYARTCQTNPTFNSCDKKETLYNAPNAPFQGLDADILNMIEGLGEPIYCNPMTTGKIVEDPNDPPLPPDKSVIYRYAKGFRAIDEAVKKVFNNIDVIDEQGKVFRVPLIWGSQERAVAIMMQSNVRKDNTGVVDRVMLPALSIYTSSYNFPTERFMSEMAVDYDRNVVHRDPLGNILGAIGGSPGWTYQERSSPFDTILGHTRGIAVDLGYTLTIWTKFWEDMNQILEQIATKFNRFAYIRIQGVNLWESTVRIDSVTNNLDTEPGDTNNRVFKFQISLTAESYIPQPIVKRKAVFKTRTEVLDSVSDFDVANIIARIEAAVGDI